MRTITDHARKRRRTLWILTLVGFVVPTSMFGKFFADNFGAPLYLLLREYQIGNADLAA